MAGDLWQWTTGYYEPYPRYKPEGARVAVDGKWYVNE